MNREEDNILICKRENNKKRSYVLVNKNQGKHYPIEDSKIYGEVRKLYNNLIKQHSECLNDNSKIIIGFAETATGIGALFSEYFVNTDSWYVTTTRENTIRQDYVDFSEEHSHATEQRLYYKDMKKVYSKDFDLFFVEDEVTTGNTIRNMLKAMTEKSLMEHCKSIYINSFLNGMGEEDFKKLDELSKELNIPIKVNWNEKLESKDTYMNIGNDLKINKVEIANYDIGDIERMKHAYTAYCFDSVLDNDVRTGVKVRYYIDNLESILSRVVKDISERKLLGVGSRVRVLGTEECMYPAIKLLNKLNNNWIYLDGKTHSTTRSPIEAGEEESGSYYGLTSRYKLHSLYEGERTTYIYNSIEDDKNSDLVIIVTDSKRSGAQSLGLSDLVTFYDRYCDVKNVYIVRL